MLNPVLPSLIYAACESLLADSTVENEHLRELSRRAEERLVGEDETRWPPTYACDVLICLDEPSDLAAAAVQSVLDQERVYPVVHLVDCRGRAGDWFERFSRHSNVVTYAPGSARGDLEWAHQLVPRFQTPYVALQSADSVSRPDRLLQSLRILDDTGGEILGAAVQCGASVETPLRPRHDIHRRFVAPETLVFRRATWVDMNSVTQLGLQSDVEWTCRAARQQRAIVLVDEPLVQRSQPSSQPVGVEVSDEVVRAAPQVEYSLHPVACDVVLPFFGHTDFAEEALRSLVDQREADTIIHLVDDASTEDTSSFLNRWRGHRGLRIYRNRCNIGQFASFNNASQFAETSFVAVQDGDDISTEDRLWRSVNQLELAGADLFGCSVELFGDSKVRIGAKWGYEQTVVDAEKYRRSTYPRGSHVSYYLENPTKVMRLSAFRALGGYADYRDRIQNRTGLDTEFMARAYHAGAVIAVSTKVLLRYRIHGDSATQNNVSGWGTDARQASQVENRRRRRLFRQGPFDPRVFGGLTNHEGVTERLYG